MMSEFLKAQLDYIFFLYGLGFILLAAASFVLVRYGNRSLPWVWLGLFGLTHGLNEWLDLLANNVGDTQSFMAIRVFVITMSFVCLVEFGRAGTNCLRGKNIGRWIFVPLLVVAGLGGSAGLQALNTTIRYSLGIVGVGWSALTMFIASREDTEETARPSLLAASVMMGLYAVAAGFVVPEAPFFPASFINHTTFFHTFGFPVQLLHGILAIGTAAATWSYLQHLSSTEEYMLSQNIRSQIARQCAVAVLAIFVIGWLITAKTAEHTTNEARNGLLSQAAVSASVVDPTYVVKLADHSTDERKPDNATLTKQLQKILSANSSLRSVSILIPSNSKITNLVDVRQSGFTETHDNSNMNQEAARVLTQGSRTSEISIVGPLTDPSGVWAYAFVPIRDSYTNRTVALLAMNVDARKWVQETNGHRLAAIGVTLLLYIMTLLSFFLILKNKQESTVQIAASERRYRSLVEGSPNSIALFDESGRYLAINQAGLKSLGRTESEVLGKEFHETWPENARPLIDKHVERALQGVQSSFEADRPRQDGGISKWHIVLNPIVDGDGRTRRFVGILFDITEQRLSEANLRIQASVINAASNQILITNTKGEIEYVNPAFEAETGYKLKEVIGQCPNILRSGKHSPKFYNELWKTILSGQAWHGEITNKRKDGSFYIEEMTVTPVKNESGTIEHFAAIKNDITEKKLYEKELDFMAHHDSLTGLPNRVLFRDRLVQGIKQASRSKRQCAVMFMDLDRFKLVNDTLGHNIGDLMLKAVVERLPEAVRKTDTIARMGGDELVFILTDISTNEEVAEIAQRVLKSLSESPVLQSYDLYTTASIGIALYPTDGTDTETLIKNADTAMYRAKDQGGNNFKFYTEAMNAAATERMKLENNLRKAVERQEFRLDYQPRVDGATGRILGVEALIRWQHPEYGLLLPDRFIPLAEKTGLIVSITKWALSTACTQNKAWQDAGLSPIDVAVNISAIVLQRDDFEKTIKVALEKSGLDPRYLTLELTESAIMQNPDSVAKVLQRLRTIGVHVSVDDFGTGYSSLGLLKSLPIDSLKVDKSFINNITVNPDDAAITGAVIAMAHSLKVGVVAEGVETSEQLRFLQSLKCDEIQGFFISRPITHGQLSQLLLKEISDENRKLAA